MSSRRGGTCWIAAVAMAFILVMAGGNVGHGRSLPQATLVYNVDILPFAPLYVAQAKDYFREEGVDLRVVLLEGESIVPPLLAGSAQFALNDVGTVLQAHDNGYDFVSVHTSMGRLTMNLVVRSDLAAARGLSRDMPIEERLQALKGMRFGIAGAGAAADAFTRYYLRKAGLNPDRDATIIDIGGGPALLAALQRGQIDAFQLSPPAPDMAVHGGYGTLLIAAALGDVPGVDDFPYEVLATTREMLVSQREVVAAVARAMARANNFILDHPEATLDIIHGVFSQVNRDILASAMESIRASVPRNGRTSEEGWINAIRIYQETGYVRADANLDPTEGVMWTDEFLPR